VPKFLLVGHGSFANRGCEAIIRTTVSLLRDQWPDCTVILASGDPEHDRVHAAAAHMEVVPHWRVPRRFSPGWWARQIQQRLGSGAAAAHRLHIGHLEDTIRSADAVLSVGGDNYTEDYGRPTRWLMVDESVQRIGTPRVLWAASVGPFGNTETQEAVMGRLRGCALVTVRESLSAQYLAENGVEANVRLVADPAFLLQPEPLDTASFWPRGDLVLALNVSPILRRYRTETEMDPFPELILDFMRELLRTTNFGVLLVPHVMKPGNDDHAYMRSILDAVEGRDRVRLVPRGLNACQTKHVLSRCAFSIGARTHATIAALSSTVPTISLSYSRKALGINLSLFGDARWVLDARALHSHAEMLDRLQVLVDARDAVRCHLAAHIPALQALARSGVVHLVSTLACDGASSGQ